MVSVNTPLSLEEIEDLDERKKKTCLQQARRENHPRLG